MATMSKQTLKSILFWLGILFTVTFLTIGGYQHFKQKKVEEKEAQKIIAQHKTEWYAEFKVKNNWISGKIIEGHPAKGHFVVYFKGEKTYFYSNGKWETSRKKGTWSLIKNNHFFTGWLKTASERRHFRAIQK